MLILEEWAHSQCADKKECGAKNQVSELSALKEKIGT